MSRVLPLAGFQVTLIGRFWVITEGRGICPIVTSSLDGPIASNPCKRKIENVVYDPETNEIGFYDPKKLFSFDSESQFGV